MPVIPSLKFGTRTEIEAIGIAGNACGGAVYLATNEKTVWLGADDGSLIGPLVTEANAGPRFYDAFKDDFDAGQGSVPMNAYYTLRNDNNYGLPGGLSKKRIE